MQQHSRGEIKAVCCGCIPSQTGLGVMIHSSSALPNRPIYFGTSNIYLHAYLNAHDNAR
jgi:hypothetical protein